MQNFFKNQWVIGIGGTVIASLVGYYIFGIGKSSPTLKVIDSPNSINTVGQIGNNTINVNKNIPPKIIKQIVNALNVQQDNLYNQTFQLFILNPSNDQLDVLVKVLPSAVKIVSSQLIPQGPALMGNGQSSSAYFVSFNTDAKITVDEIEFIVATKN